jgi:hypothetical protein
MPKEKSQRSLVSRFFGFVWRVIKFIITTILLFIGLFVLMVVYQTYQEQNQACNEFTEQITGTEDYLHNRSWKGFQGNNYCVNYEAQSDLSETYWGLREEIQVPRAYWSADNQYWGYIYQELARQNSDVVSYLADSLIQLASDRSLGRFETAELIVTFVQDIPYVLITNEECEEDYEGPCRAHETFGILSPYEFLYSLQGDCDTRSVLLYALLKHAGFRPIIVVSEQYAHAMIALDVPATGDYIEYEREKFYFWETTSHGWKPGMLPPDSNNVQYWKIALAYEL